MNSLTFLADCFFHENSVREKVWMCIFKEQRWLTQSPLCLLPQVWRTVTHKDPVASSGATNGIIQEPRGTPGGRGSTLCWTTRADATLSGWFLPSRRAEQILQEVWSFQSDFEGKRLSPLLTHGPRAHRAWPLLRSTTTKLQVLITSLQEYAFELANVSDSHFLFLFMYLFFNSLLIQAAVPYSSGPQPF